MWTRIFPVLLLTLLRVIPVSLLTSQKLKIWMNNHKAAVQKITEANQFIDSCNKGKQKLVDAKNTAEAKLKTEKDKVKS